VFQNSMAQQAGALQAAGLNSSLIHDFTGGSAAANVEIVKTIADGAQRFAVENAYATSMRRMWIMYTCIAGVGVLAAPFIKQKHMSREHTETRTGIDQMTKRPES
jgi:hypothetical protein